MKITEHILPDTISSIKIESAATTIKIVAATDSNITLSYFDNTRFHVYHTIENEILTIYTEVKSVSHYVKYDTKITLFIPENKIQQLLIESSAAYIHILGKEKLFQSCQIDVAAGALYLEEIYGDLNVKTVTGAICLKNKKVLSNMELETMVGVMDLTFDTLDDDVAVHTHGIIQRNPYYQNKQNSTCYTVTAKSSIGVITIH